MNAQEREPVFIGPALFAFKQLRPVVGEEMALAIVRSSLDETGLIDTTTPDEALIFANQLSRHGGFVEVVARTLRVQALLAGARLRTDKG